MISLYLSVPLTIIEIQMKIKHNYVKTYNYYE